MNCNNRGIWGLRLSYQVVQRNVLNGLNLILRARRNVFSFKEKNYVPRKKRQIQGKYLKCSGGQDCYFPSQFIFYKKGSEHHRPVPSNYAIFLAKRWQDRQTTLSHFSVGRHLYSPTFTISWSPVTNTHIFELPVLEKTKLDELNGR